MSLMRFILVLCACIAGCASPPTAPLRKPLPRNRTAAVAPSEPVVVLALADGSTWNVSLTPKRGLLKANAELEVSFTLPTGARVSQPVATTIPTTLAGHPHLWDIDGDGRAELLFGVGRELDHVLRFHEGQIEPYPMPHARHLNRFEDIDGDGRPDPIYRFRRGVATTCTGEIVPLVMEHAGRNLPGGELVFDDPVVRDRLHRTCDSARSQDWIDSNMVLHHVHCSRMLGASPQAAIQQLLRECAPHRTAARSCEGPCRDLDVLLAFAQLEPPLRLAEAKPAPAVLKEPRSSTSLESQSQPAEYDGPP